MLNKKIVLQGMTCEGRENQDLQTYELHFFNLVVNIGVRGIDEI